MISSLVVDGAVVVQMLKPTAAKNFSENASQIFIRHILSQLKKIKVSHVDLVWDRYIEESTARAKHGKGVRRHVVASGDHQ